MLAHLSHGQHRYVTSEISYDLGKHGMDCGRQVVERLLEQQDTYTHALLLHYVELKRLRNDCHIVGEGIGTAVQSLSACPAFPFIVRPQDARFSDISTQPVCTASLYI